MLKKLGPKQQYAWDGPNGPPMHQFVCAICDKKFFDTALYFRGIVSTKCLWCTKYNAKKKILTTKDN